MRSRPGGVIAGVVLWLVGGLLNLVGAVLVMVAAVRLGGPYPVVAGVAIAFAVAQLVLALLVFTGRRWARTVLLVLALLQLLIAVIAALGGELYSLVGVLVLLLGTVFLFTPTSTEFFRRR